MTGQVIDTKKFQYLRIKIRNYEGKVFYSANNKDAVSRLLFGMTKEAMLEVMHTNGLDARLAKHKTKNLGHFRMILGQSLRHLVLKGMAIRVGGIMVTSLDQKVPWPEGFREEPIERRPKE